MPRSELLAALAEAKAASEEAGAREAQVQGLEDQLARTKELVKAAQLAMGDMVPRAELLAVKARVDEAEAAIRASGERQRESMEALKEQARQYQGEIEELKAAMQARRPRRAGAHEAPAAILDGWAMVD